MKKFHPHNRKDRSRQRQKAGANQPEGFRPDQILGLVGTPELRLADNPGNMDLAYLTGRMPEDKYLQDLLKKVTDNQTSQAMTGMMSDSYWPNYPAAGSIVASPDMLFCGAMPTGDPVVFVTDSIFRNTGVFGRTGASKTSFTYMLVYQLVKKGYTVIVFQQKTEYDDWATDPELEGKVLPLRYSDLKIPLGQPAKGVNKGSHIHDLWDDLSRSYGRLYAQRLGEDIWVAESRSLPGEMHLPLSRFIEALQEYRPGPGGVESRYKESILYTIKDVKNCFGDIFDYYYSDFLDQLFQFKGLVPITVDGPIAGSTFLITHIIRHEYERRRCSGDDPSSFQPVVFVLEDATVLTDSNELGGRSPLIPMTFMSRLYRMGFIYCGHSISGGVDQKLLSNLESIFIFGMSGENPRRIQTMLGCTAEQARMAQVLSPGEFITLVPSFWPKSVYGRFPYIKPPGKLTEQQRQDIIRPFLDSVRAIKYIERGLPAVIENDSDSAIQGKPASVNPEELRLLVLAGTGKYLTKTQLYEQLGVSRRRGRQVFNRLEKKGLLRNHSFGRVQFPEVLERGLQIIESRGFKRRVCKGGGFEHEIGVQSIESWEKGQGHRFSREQDVFGKRLDGKATDSRTGRITFYNVGVSDPVREADNLVQIARMPVVQQNELVFVARDAKFVAQVKKLLKQRDSSGKLVKQVQIKKISDFVSV